MPLQIDGATVGEVRYARPDGTLATIGEARVWDGQWRTVYTSARSATWSHGGGLSYPWTFVSGDPDLLTTSGDSDRHLSAPVPVTVDKDIRTRNGSPFVTTAGEVQPAGTIFQPASADTFTFTEFSPNANTTVVLTGTSLLEARDQFRAALTGYGLDYRTVTELPFKLDTSQVTSMYSMFHGCTALTTAPDMDTSNVTNMANMFNGCTALTTAPDMDTSNVTTVERMFYGCRELTYVPDLDTSNVTTVERMFYSCSLLTDGNVRLIGKRQSVDTTLTIHSSGLTRQPFYDTAGNPI